MFSVNSLGALTVLLAVTYSAAFSLTINAKTIFGTEIPGIYFYFVFIMMLFTLILFLTHLLSRAGWEDIEQFKKRYSPKSDN